MLIQKLKRVGTCTSLAIILIAVDIICFSNLPMKIGNTVHQTLNMAIYIYSSILSQIIYNTFTKINTSVICGPIVENYSNIESLIKNINEQLETDDVKTIFTNAAACIFLTTILFAVISIILSKMNGEYILKKIPEPVITGSLGAIGWFLFYDSYANCAQTALKYTSLVSSIVVFAVKQRYDYNFILPLCILVLMMFFFMLRPFIGILKHDYWLESMEASIITPGILFKNLDFGLLEPKVIFNNLFGILSIAGYSMIHIVVNLPVFSQMTGCAFSFTKELQTQGIMNMFTSIVPIPCYFVSCYSVAIKKAGGDKRLYGIIIALSYIFLVFTIGFIRNFLPKFIIATLPMVFGFDFLYHAIKSASNANWIDSIVMVFTFFVNLGVPSYPILGVFAGSLLFCACNYVLGKFEDDGKRQSS
ncbi:hypothetical protein EQH57_0652 [Dictyocoela roeselum]|nr:hypothetical protein EQH57_0652 [Dictyocoela roeselum]